jgi:hypothetical protein
MRKAIDRPESAGDVPQQTVATVTKAIALTAPEVVAAITFHLLDEQIATGVCPESARQTLVRLSRAATPLVEISRSFWGEMSNHERLAWLLATTDTSYDVRRDGIAVLALRGK